MTFGLRQMSQLTYPRAGTDYKTRNNLTLKSFRTIQKNIPCRLIGRYTQTNINLSTIFGLSNLKKLIFNP